MLETMDRLVEGNCFREVADGSSLEIFVIRGFIRNDTLGWALLKLEVFIC